MTEFEFLSICGELLIDPAIALENEHVIEALKAKDQKKIIQTLKTEF